MTDKTKEAMKLALEAITTYLSESPDPSEEAVEGLCDARALIAKALAEQPAQQCWKCGDMDVAFQMKCTVPACGMKGQPAQTDWEAVAADQAMTIALLKAELQEFANKEADALEVALTESGWMWDGDQWQRPAQQEPDLSMREPSAIRDRLIQAGWTPPSQPQQEPVAWMHTMIDDVVIGHRPADIDRHPERWTPLYKEASPCPTCEALARTVMLDQTSHDTSPPAQRKPLTDEEIERIYNRYGGNMMNCVRAIERSHGIKGDA